MSKFKEYLLLNGDALALWLNDVVRPVDARSICHSESCSEILKGVITERGFRNLTEDDCIILFKDFIEPVTYKDIDLMSKDPFYSEVHNSCGELWIGLPRGMVNYIYGNAETY